MSAQFNTEIGLVLTAIGVTISEHLHAGRGYRKHTERTILVLAFMLCVIVEHTQMAHSSEPDVLMNVNEK